MPVRTRPRVKPRGAREGQVYDVSRYLGGKGPTVSYAKDGKQVSESIPKQIYYPVISTAGNLAKATVGTNAMDRNYGSVQAMQAVERLKDNGFVLAHECPIGRNALHPDDEVALFGENPKPCTDHDFGWRPGDKYRPVELCPHLEKIRDVRREEHNAAMSKAKRLSNMQAQQGIISTQQDMIKTQREIVRALEQVNQQSSARSRKSGGG